MNAKDFVSEWAAVVKRERTKAQEAGVPEVADDLLLASAPRTILDCPALPVETRRFLVEAGLPRSCAPFVTFQAVASGPLPLVEFYGVHQFSPSDVSRLAAFYVVGFDGSGNPLCLDSTRDGEIVMLDEDGFRTRTFVASSIATLAQALLILHTFPRIEFVGRLRPYDPLAADNSSFLPAKVSMLP